ncbi:hypothetical protein LSH36_281g09025 [Paralvinella palmiformis]|uniref:Mitotic-spindle organizing protein 1 n=1 Tax=Paralvinella palmiformis TaxID=53620 RepID=A0AAD9N3C7_9ANNE|nr:hypothetical protein LSH36_281g09025 [Paralvinella palmiformis]
MADSEGKLSAAREAMDTIVEISTLLNTGLDADTLAICVRLCESGANPEALAKVIQDLQRESTALKEADSTVS